MPLNRALRDEDGNVCDVIAGPFLITGLTEEDFGSLSCALTKKYYDMFYCPEVFMRVDGRIVALRVRGMDV